MNKETIKVCARNIDEKTIKMYVKAVKEGKGIPKYVKILVEFLYKQYKTKRGLNLIKK